MQEVNSSGDPKLMNKVFLSMYIIFSTKVRDDKSQAFFFSGWHLRRTVISPVFNPIMSSRIQLLKLAAIRHQVQSGTSPVSAHDIIAIRAAGFNYVSAYILLLL